MVVQERLTISRLSNFSRRVNTRYERMTQWDKEREAYLLRQKLQHVRRTKSIGILLGMLRDMESGRPVTSIKLDRVMTNLKEVSSTFVTGRGGGVEQKLMSQPAIASIFLLSHSIRDKNILR
jgi:VanZ family protein